MKELKCSLTKNNLLYELSATSLQPSTSKR